MLGISVYFKDLDVEYLKEAAQCGAKYVFTSLHIPEEDYSDLDQKLPLFLDTCQQLGLQVVPDVSPVTFDKLKVETGNYHRLKEMGFQSLRLDYGFDNYETVKQLQKDFYLMLNASVVNKEYLDGAIKAGVDMTKIVLTHNFYPRKETGLGIEAFNHKNKVFKEYGLTIQAFICGDVLKRFPLYEGLPTLECHREKNPLCAAVELIHDCGIKDVLIGDSKASIETLRSIHSYMEDKKLYIKAHLDKGYQYLYDQEIQIRKDQAEQVIRLAVPRVSDVEVYHNTRRPRGSITMQNALTGRYSGEIHLNKIDMGMDARVNVIGFIHPEYVELLNYIDHDTTIIFKKL